MIAMVVGANTANAAVSVAVSPSSVNMTANATQQFSVQVSGSTNQTVRWLVNGVPGGAPATGVISDSGLYTAPPDAANALSVKVEAEAQAAPASPGSASVTVAAGPAPGATYYVATTGNDANPGTQASPWRHIQHAADAAPAGAQVLVMAGVYNELVAITRSGTPAAGFITLAAAPGAIPTIDGTGLAIPNGQNGLITISSASWVRVKGFEVRNYVSNNANTVPVGIYVNGAGDHIEILNNHVHAIKTTVPTSDGDALGIAIYGSKAPASINWLTISGNELNNLTLGYSESVSLSGNVEFWQVTNNKIHDNNNIGINIEGFYNTAPNVAYDQARRGLVAGNVIYNISSKANPAYNDYGADGLYVSGGTLVTLQNNLVYKTDLGIEMASEIKGHETSYVWAHDNVIHDTYVTGITFGGAAASNGGASHCIVANNTLFANDSTQSGSGEVQIQYNVSNNQIVDNIIYANSQALMVNAFVKGTTPPAGLDHNLYFGPAGASGSQWIWLGKSHSSFAAYQSAVALSGNDVHSLFANPQFVNAGGGNFAIPATSPAVKLGQYLGLSGNGLTDYSGAPRTNAGTIDAGALQH
jgi:Protein of unknown function (DUF1565)